MRIFEAAVMMATFVVAYAMFNIWYMPLAPLPAGPCRTTVVRGEGYVSVTTVCRKDEPPPDDDGG